MYLSLSPTLILNTSFNLSISWENIAIFASYSGILLLTLPAYCSLRFSSSFSLERDLTSLVNLLIVPELSLMFSCADLT